TQVHAHRFARRVIRHVRLTFTGLDKGAWSSLWEVEVFSARNEDMQQSRFAASKENLRRELDNLQAQLDALWDEITELGEPVTESDRSELTRLQTSLSQYSQSYANVLQSYEALRLAEAQSLSNLIQLEPAIPPRAPVGPQTFTNTALAAVVGASLAVGAVFLIEYLDDTVKTPDDVSRALDLPVIGLIAHMEEESEGNPQVAKHPRSPIAEAFRSLRTSIEFASVDRPVQTLMITSPGPEEGKSTVAVNLSIAMAQAGKNVLLFDADLRRPRIHRLLGVSNRHGLSDLFVRTPLELDGFVRSWRMDNLAVVTTGGLPPNPAELLGSQRMGQILDLVSKGADLVIMDSPPAGVVTDAAVLAAKVDAVLLVIEPKRTPIGAAIQAMEQLRRAEANVIGIVFNNVSLRGSGYYYNGYYSGYYYHYEYDYESEKKKRPFKGSTRRPKRKSKKKAGQPQGKGRA
ncbi:MAG: polysaccharide biosynthesis tyrosine autokinase, partial [Anaerolineales bacterium]